MAYEPPVLRLNHRPSGVPEKFDESLADGLGSALNTHHPAEKLRSYNAARGVIARYPLDLARDPLVNEPDDNPIMPITGQATLTTTLATKPDGARGVWARASRAGWAAALLCVLGVGDALATDASPSGVEGTITMAPSCGGPQREGMECRVPYADIPIRLLSMNGVVLAQARTSASGHYRMPAPAGRHSLQVMPPIRLIRCPRAEAVVEDAAYTVVDIECDSGMR